MTLLNRIATLEARLARLKRQAAGIPGKPGRPPVVLNRVLAYMAARQNTPTFASDLAALGQTPNQRASIRSALYSQWKTLFEPVGEFALTPAGHGARRYQLTAAGLARALQVPHEPNR